MLKHLINTASVGDVGIEIEIEFPGPQEFGNVSNWSVKADGSLRNFGIEFVTKKAIKLDNVNKVLSGFKKAIEGRPVIQNCPRTSVHVHVNQLDKKPIELMTAMISSWLLDTTMLTMCGDRRGNQYCLTIADAEAQIKPFMKIVENIPNVCAIPVDYYKYSAVNIASLGRFGTLEFRGMEGTTDTDRIDKWINLCYHVSNPQTFKSPSELMDCFVSHDADDFLSRLVTHKPSLDMLTSVSNRRELLEDNADILLSSCFSQCDWGKWNTKMEKYITREYGIRDLQPMPEVEPQPMNPVPVGQRYVVQGGQVLVAPQPDIDNFVNVVNQFRQAR